MHGSFNLATFNATTYAQLISNNDSQTQDWHQDFAPGDEGGWEGYYQECEKLGMTPLSVIYALEGMILIYFCMLEFIKFSKFIFHLIRHGF